MQLACFRVGIAAAMISKVKGGCCIMISGGGDTNEFNGAKISFLDGGQLDASWIEITNLIVNSNEVERTIKTFNELAFKGFPLGINFFDH